jgi:hypothetical protein
MYEELTNKDQVLSEDPDNQWDSDLPIFSTRTQLSNTGCTVDHVLQLLRQLHNLSINPMISLLKPYTDDFFEGNWVYIIVKVFNFNMLYLGQGKVSQAISIV